MPTDMTKKSAAKRKAPATKVVHAQIYSDEKTWVVQQGELQRAQGRPAKTEHLFRVIGEKLPFASLIKVRKHVKELDHGMQGVYVAHDSMGCPRYIGRGWIFSRLKARKKAQPLELEYYSFYVVSEKKHEREIETLLIRAAGFLLEFNTKKKRVGVSPGSVHDYEAGTIFYERQRKRGKLRKRSAHVKRKA
jgi:hypothetical protein